MLCSMIMGTHNAMPRGKKRVATGQSIAYSYSSYFLPFFLCVALAALNSVDQAFLHHQHTA